MVKKGSPRPIVIPAQKKELSRGVIDSNLKTAGLKKADFLRFLQQ